jgi:putative membrane protein
MRRRVFQHRDVDVAAQQEPAPAPRSILRLSPRELLLCGFIENRGVVVIAAAFGLLWELGLADAWFEQVFGEETSGRGLIRSLIAAVMGSAGLSVRQVAATLAAFLALFVVIRILSMVWALIRLHGYELTRSDDDLRTAFGLFTRIEVTIPLHRIQTLTIEEGPLHRVFKQVGVKVDTAGGAIAGGGSTSAADRAWLAPVLRSADLPALLHEVLPDVDLTSVQWQGLDARASRRAFRSALIFGVPGTGALAMFLNWWTPALVAAVVVSALVHSRQYVRRTGWATTRTAVVFRSGWIWRSITVAPFAKIQAVAIRESPFDRRWRMAAVEVDTAGTGGDRVAIPFLARETAGELHASLAVEAGRTEFKW